MVLFNVSWKGCAACDSQLATEGFPSHVSIFGKAHCSTCEYTPVCPTVVDGFGRAWTVQMDPDADLDEFWTDSDGSCRIHTGFLWIDVATPPQRPPRFEPWRAQASAPSAWAPRGLRPEAWKPRGFGRFHPDPEGSERIPTDPSRSGLIQTFPSGSVWIRLAPSSQSSNPTLSNPSS